MIYFMAFFWCSVYYPLCPKNARNVGLSARIKSLIARPRKCHIHVEQ